MSKLFQVTYTVTAKIQYTKTVEAVDKRQAIQMVKDSNEHDDHQTMSERVNYSSFKAVSLDKDDE